MRIARPGNAAQAITLALLAASAVLWTCAALTVDRITQECFLLLTAAAATCTLAFTAALIGLILRDDVRDTLLGLMRATPRGGETPAHPHLVPVPERDAG